MLSTTLPLPNNFPPRRSKCPFPTGRSTFPRPPRITYPPTRSSSILPPPFPTSRTSRLILSFWRSCPKTLMNRESFIKPTRMPLIHKRKLRSVGFHLALKSRQTRLYEYICLRWSVWINLVKGQFMAFFCLGVLMRPANVIYSFKGRPSLLCGTASWSLASDWVQVWMYGLVERKTMKIMIEWL